MTDQSDSGTTDEFGEYLTEASRDPAFRAAYEDAHERSRLLDRLVRLRISRDVTQAEVAGRMQTTQSFVSELENGGTDPQLSTLQRYARALGAELRIDLNQEPASPWPPADQGAYAEPGQVRLSGQASSGSAHGSGPAWRKHAMLIAPSHTEAARSA